MKQLLLLLCILSQFLTVCLGTEGETFHSETINGVHYQRYTGPYAIAQETLEAVGRTLEMHARQDGAPRLSEVLERSEGAEWARCGLDTLEVNGVDVPIGVGYTKGDISLTVFENQIGVSYTVPEGDGTAWVFIFLQNVPPFEVTDTIVMPGNCLSFPVDS